MKIEQIDRNFLAADNQHEDVTWLDAQDGRLGLRGLAAGTGFPLRRMDPAVAAGVSDGLAALNTHTSGVRLCFQTDAAYLALKARLDGDGYMPHMPQSGSSGFDLYIGTGEDSRFIQNFWTADNSVLVSGEADLSRFPGMKTVTLYFPLYNGVQMCAVGLPPAARVEAIPAEVPVVFYGSSITQGACASRPGNSYVAMVCRMLETDYINLGFSGNAKGEPAIASYIAELPMRALVMDYDHNAPTPEHLEATLYPFYQEIRRRQPEVPILLISRPNVLWGDPQDVQRRRAIVEATYRRAHAEGDERVAFVDGGRLFDGVQADACAVDGCHPNDLGFFRMAQGVIPALRELLEQK